MGKMKEESGRESRVHNGNRGEWREEGGDRGDRGHRGDRGEWRVEREGRIVEREKRQ